MADKPNPRIISTRKLTDEELAALMKRINAPAEKLGLLENTAGSVSGRVSGRAVSRSPKGTATKPPTTVIGTRG